MQLSTNSTHMTAVRPEFQRKGVRTYLRLAQINRYQPKFVLSLTRDDAVTAQITMMAACQFEVNSDRTRAKDLLRQFDEKETSLRLSSVMNAGRCTLLLFTPMSVASALAQPVLAQPALAQPALAQPALAQPNDGESIANEPVGDTISEDDLEDFLHDVGLLDESEELDLSEFDSKCLSASTSG